jgi:ATP-dependent Clp protease ATP-binding subunit ClpA
MLELEQTLAKRLKQMRVRVDVPDDNTVFLRNVPTPERFFNKARTNLLIKRPEKGLPFLVCVDEDLRYTGTDAQVARAFSGGHKQQGWRVLFIDRSLKEDFQAVVAGALEAIGFDGLEPKICPPVAPAARAGLLETFGKDVSARAAIAGCEPTIGRDERIEELLSSLLQWQVRLPVVVGESGVGKTNLIIGAARRLSRVRPELRIVSVDLGVLMAGTLFDSDRENLLAALLKEAGESADTVLAMEHIEVGLIGVPRGPLVMADALDKGLRLIGTTLPNYLYGFETAPLARRLHLVELCEMGLDESLEVLTALRDGVSKHHRVEIGESLAQSAIDVSLALAGRLPAKAIALLDAAAARAVLSGEGRVSDYDLYTAAARYNES